MPRPVFLGPAIRVAADNEIDEIGGVVALGNGKLMAYWQQDRLTGHELLYEGFKIRVIDSLTHKQSAPISLDLGLPEPVGIPEVVVLSNGNFVVSWRGLYVPGIGYDVFFRVFDAVGAPISQTQQADPRPPGSYSAQGLDITALSNGGFVAAWEQMTNGSSEVFARIYDAAGTAESAVFQLNTLTAGGQNWPEIQALSGGKFIAIWSDQQGAYENVDGTSQVARLFQADGTPLSQPFVVNQSRDGNRDTSRTVAVTELVNGNVAMAWQHSVEGADGISTISSVVIRVFTSAGEAAGNETVISVATTDTSPSDPVITQLLDGRFMVAWSEYTNHAGSYEWYSHVLARVINADGTPAGIPFNVDRPDASGPSNPTLTTLLDGRVAVSFTERSDISGRPDLLTQILDPRLAAIDLHGSDASDQLQGTRFADTMAGGLGNDAINGGVGMDRLFGEAGNDLLNGGADNDALAGGFGNDTLLGGVGRDILTGGPGADVLTGGADNDMFVFYAGQGADQITDFELGHDLLNLRAFHFSDTAAAVAAFSQTAEGALFAVGATSILLTGIDLSDLTGSSLLI